LEYRDDVRLITRIAHMYYEDELTQNDIAKKLGISRPKVSRLLKRARELGIVQITIRSEHSYPDLEKQIETIFGIREAIIVPYYPEENDGLKDVLGRAAATYFLRVVADNVVVGLSWGTTLFKLLNHIHSTRNYDINFVSLIGGIGNAKIDVHSNQIVLACAKTMGGKAHLLHAPAVVDSLKVKESICSDKRIKEVLELGNRADIAIVGIGQPGSPTMMEAGYFTQKDMEELKKAKAIGDLCSAFFDINGKRCDVDINDRIIGISLDQLKKIPLVIGVAGGKNKKKSILGALRGGYLDVLVTDTETAKFLVKVGG